MSLFPCFDGQGDLFRPPWYSVWFAIACSPGDRYFSCVNYELDESFDCNEWIGGIRQRCGIGCELFEACSINFASKPAGEGGCEFFVDRGFGSNEYWVMVAIT